MARAMKLAVEAGREAFLAGRIPRKTYASASSPHGRRRRPLGHSGRAKARIDRRWTTPRPAGAAAPPGRGGGGLRVAAGRPRRAWPASRCPRSGCPSRAGTDARLNELCEAPGAARARSAVASPGDASARPGTPLPRRASSEFNSALVQVLNGYLEETRAPARAPARGGLRARALPAARAARDGRARPAWPSALATTRAELILEAFDRRQESLARRLRRPAGPARPRGGAVGEEVRAAARRAAPPRAPPPAWSRPPPRAADDAAYVAFENRFRGSREEIRERLRVLRARSSRAWRPVVDLGCGRGEFLELLREAGIAGARRGGQRAGRAATAARRAST